MRVRHIAALGLAAAALLLAAACVQQNNTYPVDIFTEMHYSQSIRSQEGPRLDPVPDAVVVNVMGGSEGVLEVPAINERAYVPAVAAELYRVNCSACHGLEGRGDGRVAGYLSSSRTLTGEPYGSPPPNLLESRAALDQDAAYAIIAGGVAVMPQFRNYLAEEEIRDLVAYMYDEDTGLGS